MPDEKFSQELNHVRDVIDFNIAITKKMLALLRELAQTLNNPGDVSIFEDAIRFIDTHVNEMTALEPPAAVYEVYKNAFSKVSKETLSKALKQAFEEDTSFGIYLQTILNGMAAKKKRANKKLPLPTLEETDARFGNAQTHRNKLQSEAKKISDKINTLQREIAHAQDFSAHAAPDDLEKLNEHIAVLELAAGHASSYRLALETQINIQHELVTATAEAHVLARLARDPNAPNRSGRHEKEEEVRKITDKATETTAGLEESHRHFLSIAEVADRAVSEIHRMKNTVITERAVFHMHMNEAYAALKSAEENFAHIAQIATETKEELDAFRIDTDSEDIKNTLISFKKAKSLTADVIVHVDEEKEHIEALEFKNSNAELVATIKKAKFFKASFDKRLPDLATLDVKTKKAFLLEKLTLFNAAVEQAKTSVEVARASFEILRSESSTPASKRLEIITKMAIDIKTAADVVAAIKIATDAIDRGHVLLAKANDAVCRAKQEGLPVYVVDGIDGIATTIQNTNTAIAEINTSTQQLNCQPDDKTIRTLFSHVETLNERLKKLDRQIEGVLATVKKFEENSKGAITAASEIKAAFEFIQQRIPSMEDELQEHKVEMDEHARDLAQIQFEHSDHEFSKSDNEFSERDRAFCDAVLVGDNFEDTDSLEVKQANFEVAKAKRDIAETALNAAQASVDAVRNGNQVYQEFEAVKSHVEPVLSLAALYAEEKAKKNRDNKTIKKLLGELTVAIKQVGDIPTLAKRFRTAFKNIQNTRKTCLRLSDAAEAAENARATAERLATHLKDLNTVTKQLSSTMPSSGPPQSDPAKDLATAQALSNSLQASIRSVNAAASKAHQAATNIHMSAEEATRYTREAKEQAQIEPDETVAATIATVKTTLRELKLHAQQLVRTQTVSGDNRFLGDVFEAIRRAALTLTLNQPSNTVSQKSGSR